MALAGQAALAMWWDIAPEVRADFEHWHAHEHFPERLAIPGFLRASRWRSADGGDGCFVLYELADHAVLRSPAYLARLNAPTSWSARLMPHHRHMVRSQCHVLDSRGGVTARCAFTVRLAPASGREAELRAALRRVVESAPSQPGMAGVHLLRHEVPPMAATTEQRLRGLADGAADWVLIVSGYDRVALAELSAREFDDEALAAMGAAAGSARGLFELAYAAVGTDVTGLAAPGGPA
ncbi:hypothetical protein ACPOLB_24380 [Rubrivivax sp. RP6-9]|uniref:hypothetical protein n=1 Tax=Rubrivivax sp. RP6-9 TaxID=3415750 RepID=UPI003CC639FB